MSITNKTVRPQLTLLPPFQDEITYAGGKITGSWTSFFSLIVGYLSPLGLERSFSILNGKTELVGEESEGENIDNVIGLYFEKEIYSQAIVDYLIQRVTTESAPEAGDAEELVEGGSFVMTYKPASNSWMLSGGPSSSGIVLSTTPAGQVQYTSTLITGTAHISRIIWRARTLAAKHHSYSKMGQRR